VSWPDCWLNVPQYEPSCYLENDDFCNAYEAFGNAYDGRQYPELVVFPASVYATRYKVYDGSTDDTSLV